MNDYVQVTTMNDTGARLKSALLKKAIVFFREATDAERLKTLGVGTVLILSMPGSPPMMITEPYDAVARELGLTPHDGGSNGSCLAK